MIYDMNVHLDGWFRSRNVDIPIEDAVVVANNMSVGVGEYRVLQVGVLLLRHLQQILPFLIRF